MSLQRHRHHQHHSLQASLRALEAMKAVDLQFRDSDQDLVHLIIYTPGRKNERHIWKYCYNYQHRNTTGRGVIIDSVTKRLAYERYLHRKDTGTSCSFGVCLEYDGDTTLEMSDYGNMHLWDHISLRRISRSDTHSPLTIGEHLLITRE
jgi:hypothetical protein